MKRLSLIVLLLSFQINAQSHGWLLEDRKYYEPLIAGVREPHLSALFLAAGSPIDFEVSNADPRMIWDIDVGGELPIVGWESKSASGGRVPRHGMGVGLWIPIDFHMIEDLSDASSPVVNNDYRFGGMMKLEYGLADSQWVAMRVHFGHESTHLGDEFSIVGKRRFPTSFERVNVSWEYVDTGFLYERIDNNRIASVRAGVTANVRGSYYATDRDSITESPRGPVTRSQNRIDPYIGYDGKWEEVVGVWDIYAFRGAALEDNLRLSQDITERY